MNSKILELFAKRLKSLREKSKLSQEALALKCNIDRTYIGRIERMDRNPSLEILHKIALGFNMTLSQLLDLKENEHI
jgi:transcriptional regulator with XRE-family HTH domain